ncbi:WecB/TagA/CpsF family glycosyltransferase [Pedobacter alpinus]|uniref:WecB/TagA/CpsF family glycosyltransferase n=1 Tax=Pedobacter alpinus TaxID=1590643 RepID=A0ABW5TUT3_9SPHI
MDKPTSVISLGYSIFASSLDYLPTKHQTLVNTINQYSYCLAEKDPEFKTSLKESDVLLPDGVAIVVAVKLIDNTTIKKIAGDDLHLYCLEKLNREHGSCFYLGSGDKTLDKIKDRVLKEYPNIRVGTFSPPYKPTFTDEENAEMLEKVNSFKPDVLFVGMTAPKQEIWSYNFKNQLDAQLICSIGAVFDFYAGTVRRPSQIWIDLRLEWFKRLLNEPKRIWKRYLYFGPVFFKYMIKERYRTGAFNTLKESKPL